MTPDRHAAPSSSSSSPAALLADGLAALRLPLPAQSQTALLDYLTLMQKWNRVYNLTAVRDLRSMVTRHLLDSLVVVPHVQGPRVLDVGTGPGLPGIPLAIALPDLEFVLLDRTAKKTRFITQAVGELGLTNVEVETRRVDGYHPAVLFDTVVTRAFSSVAEFIAVAGRLCKADGLLLAMKGRYPAEEVADLSRAYRLETCVRLTVPGLDEERHALCLRRGHEHDA